MFVYSWISSSNIVWVFIFYVFPINLRNNISNLSKFISSLKGVPFSFLIHFPITIGRPGHVAAAKNDWYTSFLIFFLFNYRWVFGVLFHIMLYDVLQWLEWLFNDVFFSKHRRLSAKAGLVIFCFELCLECFDDFNDLNDSNEPLIFFSKLRTLSAKAGLVAVAVRGVRSSLPHHALRQRFPLQRHDLLPLKERNHVQSI